LSRSLSLLWAPSRKNAPVQRMHLLHRRSGQWLIGQDATDEAVLNRIRIRDAWRIELFGRLQVVLDSYCGSSRRGGTDDPHVCACANERPWNTPTCTSAYLCAGVPNSWNELVTDGAANFAINSETSGSRIS